MAKNGRPKPKLVLKPGEDVWSAMARELASNPDSPASLEIMSSVNHALAPRAKAVEQLLDVLEAQLASPGAVHDAAVAAAVGHWERECNSPMELSLLEGFRKEARDRVERRKKQPPSLESILGAPPRTTDVGYQLGIHLEGIRGTWHRLWASACLCYSFGDDPTSDATCREVRNQFEAALGRELTAAQWEALVAHARNHYESVMRPRLEGSNDR